MDATTLFPWVVKVDVLGELTMPRTKWNHELRKFVFGRIRERFGPWSSWGTTTNYPQDRQQEYLDFLQALAVELRAPTGNPDLAGTAIDQQVKFAFSNATLTNKSNFRSMVLNAAAALEAKFLTYRDLPGEADLNRRDDDEED
jgi:hypothetical protein